MVRGEVLFYMSIFCRKCSNSSFYLQQRGFQVGFFCDTCGSWIKWVSKKEQEMLRKRGIKIYPQDATVELKAKKMDVLSEVLDSPIQNMGIEGGTNVVSNVENDTSFGSNPIQNVTNNGSSFDIEAEVKRRVAEELKKINVVVPSNVNLVDNNSSTEKTGSEYCSICDGSPLVPETGSKVEVSIFSGVMTVTDIDGVEILGLYKLKNCPNCGKMF